MEVRASRTSSSLKGLITAMTIFMDSIPAWARLLRHAVRAGSLSFRPQRSFAGMAAGIESNAVPDADGTPILLIYRQEPGGAPTERNAAGGLRLKSRQWLKRLLKK